MASEEEEEEEVNETFDHDNISSKDSQISRQFDFGHDSDTRFQTHMTMLAMYDHWQTKPPLGRSRRKL